MLDFSVSFLSSIFAKTAHGQQEIQARSHALGPMARRVLVLVDGRRSGQELAAFVPGDGIENCLSELLSHDCIEAVSMVAMPAPVAQTAPRQASADALAGLPLADMRSAQDLDKARNFMTNTVNNIFGHHNRISLVESIFSSQSSEELRKVYPAWANALASNSTGKKRLPELREKLFTVL